MVIFVSYLYLREASLKLYLLKALIGSYGANIHLCHIIRPLGKGFQSIFICASSVHFYTKVHLEIIKG